VTPVVIGYNWQGREARNWYSDNEHPQRAIFVDKEVLDPAHPTKENPGRPDFKKRLLQACGSIRPGPVISESSYPGVPPRRYYLTMCENMVPDAIAILRWEREPSVASR
jgi:hypothetical protein